MLKEVAIVQKGVRAKWSVPPADKVLRCNMQRH